MSKINLAVFASGNGSNAEEIFRYFDLHSAIQVKGVFTNNPNAFVLERASRNNIPSFIFTKEEFIAGTKLTKLLEKWNIDAIILAGFLWLIPGYLINLYPNRILNIHPALLPQFGGKGMYGKYVHQAVIRSGQKESGITIHLVNPQYDKGQIIFQKRCKVDPADTPETLASRIHKLEHRHYPAVIEQWLKE